jgi:hypothetical protein
LPLAWENERDTERAKLTIRWVALVVLLGVAQYIRLHDPEIAAQLTPRRVAAILAGVVLLITAESLYLWQPGRQNVPPWFKFATVTADLVVVSLLIYYTGFTRSPFFYVYFVILISNCLRYGLLMSLYVALGFNIAYVFVLGLAPGEAVAPSVLGGEGLKILAFWATAFYGGSVSARLRRQANQLRVYEETLLELRGQLAQRADSETKPEGAP